MSVGQDHRNSGNLKVAFFLNFRFTILQIIGGFLNNSIAIFTDTIQALAVEISLG